MRARANLPEAPGNVACREYEYQFPDGTSAAFTVKLCFSDDGETARIARDKTAEQQSSMRRQF